MNKVILMGRLTRDPEIRYSQGAEPICVANFSLAVDRRKGKDSEQQANFPRCTAFRKTAEFCEKYIKKGTKVVVEGRLQTGSYTNKEDQKVYTTDVIVENMEFAESKGSSGNAQANATQQGYANAPQGNYANVPPQGYQAPQGYQQPASQATPPQGYQQPAPQAAPPQGYQQPAQNAAPPQGYQQPSPQGFQQPGGGFMNIPQGIDEELPWS